MQHGVARRQAEKQRSRMAWLSLGLAAVAAAVPSQARGVLVAWEADITDMHTHTHTHTHTHAATNEKQF